MQAAASLGKRTSGRNKSLEDDGEEEEVVVVVVVEEEEGRETRDDSDKSLSEDERSPEEDNKAR